MNMEYKEDTNVLKILGIIFLVLLAPVLIIIAVGGIGVALGLIGAVFGIIVGIFGAIIGLIGGIIGAVVGGIGALFGGLCSLISIPIAGAAILIKFAKWIVIIGLVVLLIKKLRS